MQHFLQRNKGANFSVLRHASKSPPTGPKNGCRSMLHPLVQRGQKIMAYGTGKQRPHTPHSSSCGLDHPCCANPLFSMPLPWSHPCTQTHTLHDSDQEHQPTEDRRRTGQNKLSGHKRKHGAFLKDKMTRGYLFSSTVVKSPQVPDVTLSLALRRGGRCVPCSIAYMPLVWPKNGEEEGAGQ